VKMLNRLDELEGAKGADAGAANPGQEATTSPEMNEFFGQVEQVKGCMKFVQDKTKTVQTLENKALTAVRKEDVDRIHAELEKNVAEANKQCTEAKQLLTAIKDTTARLEGSAPASETRIRKNMYGTLTTSFVAAVRDYQKAQQSYKDKMQEKVARQIRIVKPDATYEEIDEAMRSGDAGAVYRAAIMQPGCDPVQQAYIDTQEKYKDVILLETSIRAINQMFRDFALLVEKQGELLDQVELQVEDATEHVQKGKVELDEALVHRKSIRKKKIIILVIILIVIAVILAIVLPKVLK